MTTPSVAIPDTVLTQINAMTAAHPFHKACGLEVISQTPGKSLTRFELNEFTLNTAGFLHGGILYGLLDVTAFLATVGMLNAGEQIVTHDFHCSILAPVSAGFSPSIEAEVERRGKGMAFIRCTAWADKPDAERKKIALATVTKSVVTGRYTR